MALIFLSGVVVLVSFAILAVIAGYKNIYRATEYRLLISTTLAIGGILLLLGACALFFYTLHVVMGVE